MFNKKKKSNLVCFDTETSGLDSHYESLIEISAIRFSLDGTIEDKFTSLLDPMKDVEPIITELTGHQNEDLRKASPFWEVLEKFVNFLDEDDILFAHNAYFDANFVGVWMSKIMEMLPQNRIYDTIALAKLVFPGFRTYKLASLIEKLNLEGINAHNAEDDVMATISLIRRCFDKIGITQDKVKPFFAQRFNKLANIKTRFGQDGVYYTFRMFAIKPIAKKQEKINIVYSAIRGKKNLKIRYNYSSPGDSIGDMHEDIELQPLTIFKYKNEIYLEGFTDDNIYFRRIDLKRIDKIELMQRNKAFAKPVIKKKVDIKKNFTQTEIKVNKYYKELLSIEQTSKIIPKYTVLNLSSICEACTRENYAEYLDTGREDFSQLISIIDTNKLVDDSLITFLDKIRAGGSFVRHNPIVARFSPEEVNYFLEGSYEVVRAITKDEMPNRNQILYYSTKEDYEKRLQELKGENDKIIKALSDQLIRLREQLNEAEENYSLNDEGQQVGIEELRRSNARLEEELDIAVRVAEDLEEKLYIIQEVMEKLKTEKIIATIKESSKSKLKPKDFTTRDIERTIVLANQGFQTIQSSTSDREYQAVKLLVLMESGETATALVRGIWTETAIHLKRNDKVSFINVFTPNWKEARIFHVFDKILNSNIDYPVSYMVIEPDLIYSASDISTPVLKNDIYCTNVYMMNKRNNENVLTPPMLKGILVNNMVDEYFITEGEFDADSGVNKLMEEKKLELSYTTDEVIEDIRRDLKQHHQSVKGQFPVEKKDTYPNLFEPYLLSDRFGFEGRLDLFHIDHLPVEDKDNVKDAIYEVKSGIPHTEHAYQLIVYKLTYESCYHKSPNVVKLLYTKNTVKSPLREPFIPVSKGHKLIHPSQLVTNLRNQLALIDIMLGSTEERTAPEVPAYMKDEDLCSKCRIYKKDCLYQRDLFGSINDKDVIRYYHGFMRIVNRNELLRKFSITSLWNDTIEEKKERFAIITGMKMVSIDGQHIKLLLNEGNNSDFKVGDSAFLHRTDITKGFMFKCTIQKIKGRFIKVKLNKAHISSIEGIEEGWTLDRSFYLNGSQKERNGLYRFLTSAKHDRGDRFINLILGKAKPEFDESKQTIKYADISKLNDNQLLAVQRSASAKDYFLVQGPPGTGKSYTLAVLSYELAKRGEKVLLTGFTNRSVDNALTILKDELGYYNFIRMGSYYSIDDSIKPYSTDALSDRHSLAGVSEIRKEIESKSIFGSTAFSVDNFILNNMHFDTVIVDESSQMTEPATLLVVTRGKRFILFGDHKQLPPVVNTEQLESVKFSDDNGMMLKSLDQSLFERLIKLNGKWKEEKDYDPATIMLNVQYRMNEEIASFPNKQFYNNSLYSSPDNANRIPLIDLKKVSSKYIDILHPKKPFVFINTRSMIISKENKEEARIVKKIIAELLKSSVPKSEIGVITPYKAQCSLIRREIESISIKGLEADKSEIIVDTVERYQGGHKEIIIVSLTVSDNNMMNFLVEDNKNEPNLNRRLNVAITRARSKLIIVGNKSVLSQDKVYRNMLSFLRDKDAVFEAIIEKQMELDLMF